LFAATIRQDALSAASLLFLVNGQSAGKIAAERTAAFSIDPG
jgi:hypothetical protein